MEYTGWTLYDEIILVIKKELRTYRGYKYPQAYLVNPKDKKQLERAVNWGTSKKYLFDENNNPIRDDKASIKYDEIKPDVHKVKNEGFTVEFLDSAHESSQGGKVSFWNCLVSKGNLKFIIGIDSKLLLHAIKESTFILGKSQETFMFARCSGGVGILHENMQDYKNAVRDMQSKKDSNKGKTSKWQLGKNYTTLTLDQLFIGEVYKPIEVVYDYDNIYSHGLGIKYNALVLRRKQEEKRIVVVNPKSFKYDSFKGYINKAKLNLNKVNMSDDNWSGALSDVLEYIYRNYCSLNKMAHRKPGDIQIETYDEYYTELQQLLDDIKKKILNKLINEKVVIRPNIIDQFIVNVTPGLSDLDKELLRYICDKNNIPENYILYLEDKELKQEIFEE